MVDAIFEVQWFDCCSCVNYNICKHTNGMNELISEIKSLYDKYKYLDAPVSIKLSCKHYLNLDYKLQPTIRRN